MKRKRIMDRLIIEGEVYSFDSFISSIYDVGFGKKYGKGDYEFAITDEDVLERFEDKKVRVTIEVIE